MSKQTKLQKVLKLMLLISNGLSYNCKEISKRLNIDQRSVYRYIADLRAAGFIVSSTKEGRFYIHTNPSDYKDLSELLHFTKEEDLILQKAIHFISEESLLKQNLVKKLYALYDFDRVAESIVKPEHLGNIQELIKAIKYKNKVILRGYFPPDKEKLTGVVVEPFDFTANYDASWAYDIGAKCCRAYKNARITSVQILPESWENADKHKASPTDVFRVSSAEKTDVTLKLSARASKYLREEYPMSEEFITPIDEEHFEFSAPVSDFKRIGRFIMGLNNEISIISPKALKTYIKNRVKNILTS